MINHIDHCDKSHRGGASLRTKKQAHFGVFLAMWNRREGLSTPKVHFKIARFLERQFQQHARCMLLMAFRACGKSTLMALFCAWVLYLDPNLRILVISADHALARKMVRNVKRIIEKHPMTRHLTPQNHDDAEWAGDRFTVARERELRDPSMLARGISANLTGMRADIIICDDVEVPRTCDTAQKRQELREKLDELNYILTPDGTQIYIGTPHCHHTIYADAPRREFAEEDPFLGDHARLVVPIVDEQGRSAWPERFSTNRIAEIKKSAGPIKFKSQMMCEPVQIGGGYLRPERLQIYHDDLHVIGSNGKPLVTIGERKIVSVSAWWDPSFGIDRGDRSILAVVYRDGGNAFLLHHLAQITVDQGNEIDEAAQQCRAVVDCVRQFMLPIVTLEINGIGRFLPGILRRELTRAGLLCAVNEVASNIPKDRRILESFDAVMAARALHVHHSVLKTPLLMEMEDWQPNQGASHDDCLDAVAGALSTEPVRIRRNTKWDF